MRWRVRTASVAADHLTVAVTWKRPIELVNASVESGTIHYNAVSFPVAGNPATIKAF